MATAPPGVNRINVIIACRRIGLGNAALPKGRKELSETLKRQVKPARGFLRGNITRIDAISDIGGVRL
jgi:hypothetical protein